MVELKLQIDRLLAMAMAGTDAPWPDTWHAADGKAVLVERAIYHGIASVLIEQEGRLIAWPIDVLASLREQAVGQAMWEMRHRLVLTRLLAALDHNGIKAILLKGTALAYDLYENPSTRTRGDTDILVARCDLAPARAILETAGFRRDVQSEGASDELSLQEVWNLTLSDGTSHTIDLHWQAINSLALQETLSFADCSKDPLKLPRLCDAALTMDRRTALIFACMHRAAHITSPYIVDDVTYYGGDRLIWAYDIHLLAAALAPGEWDRLCADALDKGLGAVCLDGLIFARKRLRTRIPGDVMARLAAAPPDARASAYLLHSGQAGRALKDLQAVPGLGGKVRFLIMRALPSRSFMRGKYPHMQGRPLALLYLRRLAELVRKRPERSER